MHLEIFSLYEKCPRRRFPYRLLFLCVYIRTDQMGTAPGPCRRERQAGIRGRCQFHILIQSKGVKSN